MKKIITLTIVLLLTMALMAGCGDSGASQSKAKEFLGKFSGPAGSLEFLPGNEIKIDLSDDAKVVWMIGARGNHKTHKYQFITQKNEVVPYDKAENINYTEVGKTGFFMQNYIKVENDKVTLYPEKSSEAVFTRVAK